MKFVGNIVSFLGLYIVYLGTFDQRNSGFAFDWGMVLLYCLLGLPVLVSGGAISSAGSESEQTGRNDEATDILTGGNKQEPFALYLRPFKLDGALVLETSGRNLFSWENYDRPGDDTMERVLTDALARSLPLVGLGGGTITSGFGGAGLMDNWQSVILEAMQRAECIFYIPGDSPGALWEVEQLAESAIIGKTAFIMPPLVDVIQNEKTEDVSKKWARLGETILQISGLNIPEYDSSGLFFGFNRDLSLKKKVTIKKLEPRSLAKKINQFFET